jgi:hypothetical protein
LVAVIDPSPPDRGRLASILPTERATLSMVRSHPGNAGGYRF